MADEIRIAICGFEFEVPVVGRQPCIEHLSDIDASVSKDQRAWRLLAAMAGVAFDANSEGALILHLIIAALMVAHRKSIETQGVAFQQTSRIPNLFLARLLRCGAFVAGLL